MEVDVLDESIHQATTNGIGNDYGIFDGNDVYDNDDLSKLMRVVKYISGTIGYGIRFCKQSDMNNLCVWINVGYKSRIDVVVMILVERCCAILPSKILLPNRVQKLSWWHCVMVCT